MIDTGTSCTHLSTGFVHNLKRCDQAPCARANRWTGFLFALLSVALLTPRNGTADRGTVTVESYLVFETTLDGRCHNLSEGGKLTSLRNTHPTKTIEYRLVRMFAERPQGLMDGSIAPTGGAQKLGCDKVGGRVQTWRIKRARFAQE
jgi:hypothetical protein